MHGMRTTLSGNNVEIRNPFIQFTIEKGLKIQRIVNSYITVRGPDEYNFKDSFEAQLKCVFNSDQIKAKGKNGRLETAVKRYVENMSRDAIRNFAAAALHQKDGERKSFHERELQFVEYSKEFMLKLQ